MSNNDEWAKQSFAMILTNHALTGASMNAEEWAEHRDGFTEGIGKALDQARAQIRYKIAESMFRTTEEE